MSLVGVRDIIGTTRENSSIYENNEEKERNNYITLNTICSELEKENPQKNLLKTTIRSLDSFLSIANGKVIIYKYSRWYFTVFLGCSDPYSYTSCFL